MRNYIHEAEYLIKAKDQSCGGNKCFVATYNKYTNEFDVLVGCSYCIGPSYKENEIEFAYLIDDVLKKIGKYND